MTTKVNGYLNGGAWFERDTTIVSVTIDAGNFLATGIDSDSWKIMQIMQTRGTVIGYNPVSATVAHFMFGSSGGEFNATVNTQLQNAIIAGTAATTCTLATFASFAGSATGTVVPGTRPAV